MGKSVILLPMLMDFHKTISADRPFPSLYIIQYGTSAFGGIIIHLQKLLQIPLRDIFFTNDRIHFRHAFHLHIF